MQILRRKPSTWKRSLSGLRKSMCEMWSTEPLENLRSEYEARSRQASRGANKRNRSKSRHKSSSRSTSVHNVDNTSGLEDGFERLMFDTIDANKDVRTEVYASLDIRFSRKHKPATLKDKVDTGAQGNVLPLRIYRQMCPENLDTEGYPQPRS